MCGARRRMRGSKHVAAAIRNSWHAARTGGLRVRAVAPQPAAVRDAEAAARGRVEGRISANVVALLLGILLGLFAVQARLAMASHKALSPAESSWVHAALAATAITAAVSSPMIAKRLQGGGGRLYWSGLACCACAVVMVGMAALDGSFARDFWELFAANVFIGAGFGLIFPTLTRYVISRDGSRADKSVLMLNGLLGGGLCVTPFIGYGLLKAGAWWLGMLIVAEVVLLAVIPSLRLNFTATLVRRPGGPRAAVRFRARVYAALVVLCAGLTIAIVQGPGAGQHMMRPSAHVVLLVWLWPALVMLSRVMFGLIDRVRAPAWAAWAGGLGPFILAGLVLAAGMLVGDPDIVRLGMYLLAVLACAAYLPILAGSGTEDLTVLSLALAAGIAVLFAVEQSTSGSLFEALRSSGAPVAAAYVIIGLPAVVCALLITALLRQWPGPGRGHGRTPEQPSTRRQGG
jgi:MFS family permease